MRTFLVVLVLLVGAFIAGHLWGDVVVSFIEEKTGMDLPGGTVPPETGSPTDLRPGAD